MVLASIMPVGKESSLCVWWTPWVTFFSCCGFRTWCCMPGEQHTDHICPEQDPTGKTCGFRLSLHRHWSVHLAKQTVFTFQVAWNNIKKLEWHLDSGSRELGIPHNPLEGSSSCPTGLNARKDTAPLLSVFLVASSSPSLTDCHRLYQRCSSRQK